MEISLKNERGQLIGFYDEEKNVLNKTVKKSQHLFRKLNALGVDGKFLHEEMKPGGTVIIKSSEENLLYISSRENLLENGKHLKFTGHGLQVFLPLPQWDIQKL